MAGAASRGALDGRDHCPAAVGATIDLKARHDELANSSIQLDFDIRKRTR